MKILVITFCLLSAQLMASSVVLTHSTRHIIRSGKIFDTSVLKGKVAVDHYIYGALSKFKNPVLAALGEVNKHPTLKEEARDLVLHKHGGDRLAEFDDMLLFERITNTMHALGIFERLENTENTTSLLENRQRPIPDTIDVMLGIMKPAHSRLSVTHKIEHGRSQSHEP